LLGAEGHAFMPSSITSWANKKFFKQSCFNRVRSIAGDRVHPLSPPQWTSHFLVCTSCCSQLT
jgi:hypothetical protein